jgi:hypothetical protein
MTDPDVRGARFSPGPPREVSLSVSIEIGQALLGWPRLLFGAIFLFACSDGRPRRHH